MKELSTTLKIYRYFLAVILFKDRQETRNNKRFAQRDRPNWEYVFMTFEVDASLLSQLEDASVIFVDDDLDYTALFRAHAERLRLKAVVISDPLKVVPVLNKTRHKAKLLITDLQMPTLDGLDIAEELTAIGSSTTVAIVTSDLTSKRAQEAKSRGYEVRKKPIDVAGFRDLLAPVLGPG
jgi:CheY-like chemotaxis protein